MFGLMFCTYKTLLFTRLLHVFMSNWSPTMTLTFIEGAERGGLRTLDSFLYVASEREVVRQLQSVSHSNRSDVLSTRQRLLPILGFSSCPLLAGFGRQKDETGRHSFVG